MWRTPPPLHLREQSFRLAHRPPEKPGYFSYVYQPPLGPQGQMTALVCTAQEVTAQVEARQQVQALNGGLTAANAELLTPNLRSIVYNLLSNAVKYRAPDRPAQVWLQAEQRPKAVMLMVQNNGLGLTDGQQQRLFGVFQRLHTHVEGTGVGLCMTKRLIENGGGHISVINKPNLGSTFTVVFPNSERP